MKTIVYSVTGFILLLITAGSLVMGNEAVFAPMLMTDLVFLTMWKFRPEESESANSKSAYYAIITFGVLSALFSIAVTLLVPVYATQWGLETHPNDSNGILYPVVNDGRENCYLASLLFLINFGFSLYNRIVHRRKALQQI